MKRREAIVILAAAAGAQCVPSPAVPGPPPTRVLAGDDVPDWADAAKADRQRYAFLTDDEGFIVPGDLSTLNLSALQKG